MHEFFQKVIKKRKLVIIIFICAAILCGFLMVGVRQNYDLSEYLPKDSNSKAGIDVLKEEYSYNGSAVMLVEDVSIVEAVAIKEQVSDITGVRNALWLDDVIDLKQPIEIFDEDIIKSYYVEDDALFQIVFTEDNYSINTRNAIDEIKETFDNAKLSGSAVDASNNINSVTGEVAVSIIIGFIIILIILLLATDSYFEVVLFLTTISIAIVINMGTNIIFGEISYITFATAAILQLAISMDYSIFLLNRFNQIRKTEDNVSIAMLNAIKASFSTILSSGLTTIMGFAALIFMSYTIGRDMGIVLAKGIVFSLVCVMVLLPALGVIFVKLIDATKHKSFLPTIKKSQHKKSSKKRYIFFAVLTLVCVISYMAQSKNVFIFSSTGIASDEQVMIDKQIEDTFGVRNQIVVLVKRGDEKSEYDMAKEFKSLANVKTVQGYYTYIDYAMPQEMVPSYITDEFLSANFSRYIVEINAPIESEETFKAVEGVRKIASLYYLENYVTGSSPIIYDIKEAATKDFSLVSWLSIIFVGIVVLITFKSVLIPIILLLVIQTSIWINMSVPYFKGTPLIFLGYMIISAVQLGATIDYAILMTNYYIDARKTMEKREAAEHARENAGVCILTSCVVLASAGYVVSLTFSQESLSQLGTLIGRGALLSGVITIVVLPQILKLFDKLIEKTTLKKHIKELPNEKS